MDDMCEVTQYGHTDLDMAEIEAMLATDPNNEYLLDIAAFAYYSDGRLQEALAAYTRLVALSFGKACHHLYLGNVLYKLERSEDAYREWKLAEKLDEKGKYGKKARERLSLVNALASRAV